MENKETTHKEVEDYVKQNFPNENVWDFVLDAVVNQKEFLESMDSFQKQMESVETKAVEYHPLPPVIPSLGDGYDLFPTTDGRVVLRGGSC